MAKERSRLPGAPAPAGSYENYKPVPGKSDLEVDPHGHYRYTPQDPT